MCKTGLRKQLQTIINENSGLLVGNQIALISDLKKIFPHDIKLEAEARMEDDRSWRYNCFTYALRLLDSPEFVAITERYPFLFANSSFVSFLIRNHLTQSDQNITEDDDYIIYFRSAMPTHAGRMRSGRVVSKWGQYHLWSHRIWEVPLDYGDNVSFFRQIPLEDCISAFKTWVDTIR